MIDKLKEFEELSYSIGDFHDTSEESEQRLEQLRKEINQSIKLQELLKERISHLKELNEILNQGRDRDSVSETISVLQSLWNESEKSGKTYINHKQKSIQK